MTAIQYDGHVIKFTEYKDKKKSKSKEFDFIKQLDQIIERFNKDETGHYNLRLLKAVKRGWF